ncbi:hypothetical protein EYB26_003174 [Talaromyces marneffei]|uniref:uncharacterized protein n=1 Tax=Talaromyces marneffei TaxID=37727 RepID=UPI0012A8691B|nr:uncharacterized protein EYB26_003174 [Talaromyces marneffei]QGA15516.1 hypothetical protein EYB26_003174 [Talaromyces marneffei]
MYWLNGVPRVYAVNGPSIPLTSSPSDQEEPTNEFPEDEGIQREKPAVVPEDQKPPAAWAEEVIKGLCNSRNGQLFATMTESSISVWQTKPTVVVATVARSQTSLKAYGPNVSLLLHPDSTILVAQTQNGYLLTYTVASDANTRVYQQQFDHSNPHRRQQLARHFGSEEFNGIKDVSIRFRMAIKVESGIVGALALDNELVVATLKPAAIQCIRWTPDKNGTQTTSELLSRILNTPKKITVTEMVYDRAMSLLIWITSDGHAYTVQRKTDAPETEQSAKLFKGHCFHTPTSDNDKAIKAAVNARFSLLAVSCSNGDILVYTAKDYVGNVVLSHRLQPPASTKATGDLTFMSYSPDGYCLFAGFQKGWANWSVFGKPGGNSFTADRSLAESNSEDWLTGVSMGCWIGGGSDIILSAQNDRRLWLLETARSALTGCYSPANLSRALLQTGTEIILYRGHDLPDLMTISGKDSLWHHAQYPPAYLHAQWPIRACVVSQDGRYVSIAGRRGLAHYSVSSGRWKTFEDSSVENSFAVRGGMCWYGHILIAAVESNGSYELRLYSRELPLTNHNILHTEYLPSPVVFIGPSGEDSLLVYTYDNILYHYVINSTYGSVSLVPVGQIAFYGIVRAPTRVRSISWILPEEQMRNGDPSQDVKVASVLLLVDGNLVLLQPSVSDTGDLKYDMRIVAQDVEYYVLMRDQLSFNFSPPAEEPVPSSPSAEVVLKAAQSNLSLRDSLWMFCGRDLVAWSDVQEILQREDVPKPLPVPVDFYPLSVLLNKGIILGVESEMIQRRDITFSILKYAIRTHLFLPYFLQHSLASVDMPSALSLSHYYSHLSYFPHALEVLLHHVLDDAVDGPNRDESLPLLPSVISFLQASLPADVYLDIVVQCTRKNEIRSWRTLFAHLPPPKDLFEQALKLRSLKTAAGYLLVLQALDDEDEETSKARTEDSAVRLLGLAAHKSDWDLCAELARFLIALDGSGEMLRRTIDRVGIRRSMTGQKPGNPTETSNRNMRGLGLTLGIPAVPSSLSPRRTQHRRRKGSDMSSIASDGTASNLSPIMSKTDDEGASVSEGGSSGLDDSYHIS